ncbi:hypothetical protein G7069_05485 [Lysobacter sp. HDW10]|jgi:hypothetical protein|uniref:hypothetical protein n=1 Tax=Lysobacter sp. HDW10 TaxID=2714936 RepID=UPI00140901DF|nr:hypothetical protein [Lysobacter sp. HDW10]QIK81094.1 hypothetical protein G7069_05485 [Lysobacter sp. HDW10]
MKWLAVLMLGCAPVVGVCADSKGVHLYDEGALGLDYNVAPGTKIVSPSYPFAAAGSGDNVCISLAYRVQPDGQARGFAVLNNWTSNTSAARSNDAYLDPYARAAAEAVSHWHFVPKVSTSTGKQDAAVSIATFAFKGAKGGDNIQQIRARCKVDNLAAYEGRLRRMGAMDPDMNKSNYLGNIEREWRENNRFVFDYPLDHFQR